MRAFKVALIVFFSIIGIVGATVLGLYLTGKFEAPKIPPENIYFAEESTNEAGDKILIQREGEYFVSSNFEMILSTSTADSNINDVELGFLGVNNTILRKYLKVNNETSTPFCYTIDEDGEVVKYSLTSKEEATHVADPEGKLVLPKVVKLNEYFTALACVAPDDDFAGVIDETTPLYVKGGVVALHAQSEQKLVDSARATVNIDVPVSDITVLPTTSNGGNDSVLNFVVENDQTYYVVNLETYFGLEVEFTPKRSAYVFGKDGTNGEAQYKKVLISLNNDETHFDLVDFDGKKVDGVSDVLRLLSHLAGKGQINVRTYKNGIDCEGFAGLTLEEQYNKLATIGIEKKVLIKVEEISIDGFETTDKYNQIGSELAFSINNKLILTANGADAKYDSLGINILADGYSQGLVQKEIENIYLSIQVYKNGGWVDATAADNKYFAFVGSEILTIGDQHYYKVIFNANAPNNSYWEIAALTKNESEDYSAIRINVYYRGGNGEFAGGEKFGPYEVNCVVLSGTNAEVEWGETGLKSSEDVVADARNEVVIFFDEEGNPVPVIYNISNFAKITNLNENPTHTMIKYFVLSSDDKLDEKINCKKYQGKIQGVNLDNGIYLYELSSNEKLNIVSMGGASSYEFDLFFGVVEHDHLGNATVSNGEYKVRVLPTANNGDLITIPFRVSKTAAITGVSTEIVSGKAEPYGAGNVYVLQNTQNSLKLTITINAEDFEIFKKQVELGNIVLKAYDKNGAEFNGIYYYANGKIALKDALAVYMENVSTPTATLEINLSVDIISEFQNSNDIVEKFVTIKLEYNVENGDEESVDTIIVPANEIGIYSGKILNLSLNKIDNGSTIQINKNIDENGQFATEYLLNGAAVELFVNSNVENGLNIIVTGFGVDDSIQVISSNSSVLSVTTSVVGNRTIYLLTPLKSGAATLTIAPNFAHKNFVEYVLNFDIDADFTIDDNDLAYRQSQVDSLKGILSYQDNFGYTFIGAPIERTGDEYKIGDLGGYIYYFRDLVQLKAKKGESETDCTSMLKFSINSDDEDLLDYIQFIHDNETREVIGFKVNKKFGREGSFVVYYHSAELGYNSGVLKINIQPYWRAEGTINNQLDSEQIEGLVAGSKFVYAETGVVFNNFKILGYNLETGKYDQELSGEILGAMLTPHDIAGYNSWGTNISFTRDGQIVAELTTADGAPSAITFKPLKERMIYTLTLGFNGDFAQNKYNFAVDYPFVVYPNIKVGGNLTAVDGIYELNDINDPFENGVEIKWEGNSSNIVFERFSGNAEFGAFLYKNYLVGENGAFKTGTSFGVSGATKLSCFELVISYGGKEFTFRYYAEPAIDTLKGKPSIIYAGQEFISIYAGQNISDWGVNFGRLASSNTILSMEELDALVGTEIFDDKYAAFNGSLTLTKNEHGLFESYVVAVNGEEYVVRKVMIFPAEWTPYVSYNGEDSKTDVKNILEGNGFEKEITSGKTLSEFTTILTANNYAYQIKDRTTGAILDKNNTLIDVVAGEIVTYASGKDAHYEITFTVYFGQYPYTFKYFVNVKASQTININYPYDNVAGNSGYLDNFEKAHYIYYNEFINNKYSLNLTGKKYNMFGQQYVELLINQNLVAQDVAAENSTPDYNKLHFEIYSLLVNGEVIESANFKDHIAIDGSKVEITELDSGAPMNIVIRVWTLNGAEEYYKIVTQTNLNKFALYKGDAKFELSTIPGNLTSGENGIKTYDLSGISLKQVSGGSASDVEGLNLKFAVLVNGDLQGDTNLIYINGNTLTINPSPELAKATLYAFCEEGIVAKYELEIESPIAMSQTGATEIYADRTITLTDYLSILVGGNPIGTAGITFGFLLDDTTSEEIKKIVSIPTEGDNAGKLVISPYAGDEFTITIKVSAYGGGLLGTGDNNAAKTTLTFTIKPNIVVENQTRTAQVGQPYSFDVSGLFEEAEKSISEYEYSIKSIESDISSEEFKLFTENWVSNGKIVAFTFTPGPVATKRTIVVKIDIMASGSESVLTTGTLTITINPDTKVVMNYPTYGTGQNVKSHLVYWGDYFGRVTVNEKDYDLPKAAINPLENITINGGTSNTVIALTYAKDSDKELISITDNKILIKSSVSQNTIVEIQVCVDGLLRETYLLEICKDPIFSAKFENGIDRLDEILTKNEINPLNNHFMVNNGSFVVITKENRAGDEFSITVVATDKRTGEKFEVELMGKGGVEKQSAALYFAEYTADGQRDFSRPVSNGNDGVYSLVDIFRMTDPEMYTYHINDYSGYYGVVANGNAILTEPSQKITFYFNNYQIPYSVAYDLFAIINDLDENKVAVNLDGYTISDEANSSATFTLQVGGNEVANYSLDLHEDYKFADNAFAESPDKSSGTTGEVYEDGEFDAYKKDDEGNDVSYYVSKTIELNAGTTYSLVNLLKSNLGLQSYRAGTYKGVTELYLSHSEFKTNENAFSDLISLQSKVETVDEITYYDWNITPNGAKNGGDIVHLLLKFGSETKERIIRIKINPTIEITPVSSSGEMIVRYEDNGEGLRNITLSELVYVTGNYDVSQMTVAVGAGSIYVNGTGSNRLDNWISGEGESQTTAYGIRLKKTIFGGNIIDLTIADRFGYSEQVRIQYMNETGASPQIVQDPGYIYEGQEFNLVFATQENGEIVYKRWNGATFDENNFDISSLEEKKVIIIGNVANPTDIAAEISVNNNIEIKISDEDGTTKMGFNNNDIFKKAITLLPTEFGFKVVLTATNNDLGTGVKETLELPVEMSLNQRYKVVLKSPYDNYSSIYLGEGNVYPHDQLFTVWDYLKGNDATLISAEDGTTIGWSWAEDEPPTFDLEDKSFDSNKLCDIGEQNFKFEVQGVDHDYEFNVILTPKYWSIKSPDGYDINYGKIVDGTDESLISNFEAWSDGFKLLDYYGNILQVKDGEEWKDLTFAGATGLKYEIIAGEGSLSDNDLTVLTANNNTITLSVKTEIGTNDTNVIEIGTVEITMRKYNKLVVDSNKVVNTPDSSDTLSFAEWTNGIMAHVVGTGTSGTAETMPSGLSFFSFTSATEDYNIVYEEKEWKLKKRSGNFTTGDKIGINVSYLGKQLGTILLTLESKSSIVVYDGIDTTEISCLLGQDRTISAYEWMNNISVKIGEYKAPLFANKEVFTFSTTSQDYDLDESLQIVKLGGESIHAGETVAVKVYYLGKEIGTITVKAIRCNGIDATDYKKQVDVSVQETNTIEIEDWAKDVKMKIKINQGGNEAEPILLTDLTNKLTFKCETTGYTLNESLELVKNSGNFANDETVDIKVFYLGADMGTITVKFSLQQA